jgi:hypothetical protein
MAGKRRHNWASHVLLRCAVTTGPLAAGCGAHAGSPGPEACCYADGASWPKRSCGNMCACASYRRFLCSNYGVHNLRSLQAWIQSTQLARTLVKLCQQLCRMCCTCTSKMCMHVTQVARHLAETHVVAQGDIASECWRSVGGYGKDREMAGSVWTREDAQTSCQGEPRGAGGSSQQ